MRWSEHCCDSMYDMSLHVNEENACAIDTPRPVLKPEQSHWWAMTKHIPSILLA